MEQKHQTHPGATLDEAVETIQTIVAEENVL
jgi:hypothetical protein